MNFTNSVIEYISIGFIIYQMIDKSFYPPPLNQTVSASYVDERSISKGEESIGVPLDTIDINAILQFSSLTF